MKLLTSILIIFCLTIPGRAWGQQYLGKHKSELRKMMKENSKELYEDDSSKNPVFNMVKYVDRLQSQTLIYFFSEEDTCQYSKWMYDYSMLNKVVSNLNENYQQSADDSWHYSSEGQAFRVTLTTGDWFFTITTKSKEKE
jgi:hypothetical protein